MCVQGTAASGRVVPPSDFKPWIGHYLAGGDVTTVPDHRYWLQPQPEAGGKRGDRGACAWAEVGNGHGRESEESRDFRKRNSPLRKLCCHFTTV